MEPPFGLIPNMTFIRHGFGFIGTNNMIGYVADREGPQRLTFVDDLYMDDCEVTNAQFRTFVDATDYKTDSEEFGWSFVFHSAVPETIKALLTHAVAHAKWWLQVPGASWLYPEGFSEALDVFSTHRDHHAVSHISWNDAKTYCAWKYKDYADSEWEERLPTEPEWEYAAKGGVPGGHLFKELKYPWGNKLFPNQTYRANYFQGHFPNSNTALDGHSFVAPVGSYAPQNALGLHDMVGNVWEWTESEWGIVANDGSNQHVRSHDDAIQYLHEQIKSETGIDWQKEGKTEAAIARLLEYTIRDEWRQNLNYELLHHVDIKDVEVSDSGDMKPRSNVHKVQKGGSFLCHRSYCNRYRIAARHGASADSGSLNTGFRCVLGRKLK